MPMLEGVDDEVTVLMTIFLMIMGLVVTWLFASFQHETQQQQQQQVQEVIQPVPADSETQYSEPSEPIITEPDESETAVPEPGEGQIRVRIKYLDDRTRCVLAPANAEISAFKRSHFSRELAQDLLVRLIHNGRELQAQNTLDQYNITDLSTVHCLVVPSHRGRGQQEAEAELTDLDLSHLMLPMFTLILALIWYCRILYRNFFNALSTLALVGITVLYVFTVIMTWRSRHRDQRAQTLRHPHHE